MEQVGYGILWNGTVLKIEACIFSGDGEHIVGVLHVGKVQTDRGLLHDKKGSMLGCTYLEHEKVVQ